jgi:FkbM family methyltransferase
MDILRRLGLRRPLPAPAPAPPVGPKPPSPTRVKLDKANAKLAKQTEALEKLRAGLPRKLRRARSDGILQGLCAALGPGDVVADCGANVGKVTEMLAATGAEVHAFEPDPHAFAILERRFAGMANVTLYQAAVATRAGQVTFHRTDAYDGDAEKAGLGNTLDPSHTPWDGKPRTAVTVAAIDLAAWVAERLAAPGGLTFLKLDVEGAEIDLLPRLMEADLLDRIRLTVAETHEIQFPHRAADYAALRAAIAARYPATRVDLDWI